MRVMTVPSRSSTVMSKVLTRQRGFYSDAVLVETGLEAPLVRDGIRAMATSRPIASTSVQRRRQILGWNFTERGDEFSLQPRYGDTLSMYAARFVGHV